MEFTILARRSRRHAWRKMAVCADAAEVWNAVCGTAKEMGPAGQALAVRDWVEGEDAGDGWRGDLPAGTAIKVEVNVTGDGCTLSGYRYASAAR